MELGIISFFDKLDFLRRHDLMSIELLFTLNGNDTKLKSTIADSTSLHVSSNELRIINVFVPIDAFFYYVKKGCKVSFNCIVEQKKRKKNRLYKIIIKIYENNQYRLPNKLLLSLLMSLCGCAMLFALNRRVIKK